jgi:hypothetical protein
MLYGARQVGKTYILKKFGENEFDNMVYVNCYMNNELESIFKKDVDIARILSGIAALTGAGITPGKTLIFFDEVQEIPEIVAALKYFCEQARDLHVAVAGSLLGVLNMDGISFPTGKVDILHMGPMTYAEFLEAAGETKKCELLNSLDTELINAILPSYIELLRQYYFVGGMPEAVAEYVKTKDTAAVRQIQTNIIAAYEADIAKHAGKDTLRARMVFQSIPSQLAKENKKFVFGALKKGARANDFENAIQWLVDAGLIIKVKRVSKAALPLRFYYQHDAFKLFLLDIGLAGAMAQVPASQMLISDNIFSEFKGAFSENFVATQVAADADIELGYYSKDNSTLEIDFIAQCGSKILPIEVKAEENVKSKSLRQFVTIDNAGSGLHGIRFSMKGFKVQEWMSNIPLCAVEAFLHSIPRG